MKTRESGMPPEAMWMGFFEPSQVLAKLGLTPGIRLAVEFGCGYGTFTLPAARLIEGVVHAIDIEPEMIDRVREKLVKERLTNVSLFVRDFVEEGVGLPDAAADYAMLFNILHAECPETLTREAWRVLRSGGRLAILHWRCDRTTPRGPSMPIRPRPEQCRTWAEEAGFVARVGGGIVDIPPYHYGLVLQKP